MRFSPYSYSKISTYQSCPKKFHFQYVLKVGDVVLDSPALAKGRCVHSILENYPDVPEDIKKDDYYEISKEVCDKFLQSNLSHYVLNNKPKFAEQKIGMTKDLSPCEYSDKEALFKGIVDQVMLTLIDEVIEIEIDNIENIPDGFELVKILND